MHFYANLRRKFENSFPPVLRVCITLAIKVCLQPQHFSYRKAFIHILSHGIFSLVRSLGVYHDLLFFILFSLPFHYYFIMP